jgi:molybdate transport system substrate-binding protein
MIKITFLAFFAVAFCAFLALSGCRGSSGDDNAPAVASKTLTVSAAADLMPAFQEIGRLYAERNGTRVNFNFGSTGQLAQQIERGAPVDVFAAANVAYIDELENKNLILPDTKRLYATGRITVWTRRDSRLRLERIEDLARDDVRRIAIANPEHAPYGIAAREALETAGVWEKVQSRLVFGENISQTLQYAESGNVDAAIVALSLSVSSENGRWTLVPAELHKPLKQALAVIKSTKNETAARAFAAFVNGAEGRGVMQKYGFILPDEDISK